MLQSVQAVFNTTELLESILHGLPAKDLNSSNKGTQTLLLAQRVCRRWKTVIEKSAKLQRALFLMSIDVESLTYRISLNHDSGTARGAYFSPSDEECLVLGNPLLGEFHRNILPGGHWQLAMKGSNLPRSWHRPEASWRRMLLTQPGTKLRYNTHDWRSLRARGGEWSVDFDTKDQCADEVYDGIVPRLRVSQRAGRFDGQHLWDSCEDADRIESIHLGHFS